MQRRPFSALQFAFFFRLNLRLPDAVRSRFGGRGEEIANKVAKFNEENDLQLLTNVQQASTAPSPTTLKTGTQGEPNRTLCEPSFEGGPRPMNPNNEATPHQTISADVFLNKEWLDARWGFISFAKPRLIACAVPPLSNKLQVAVCKEMSVWLYNEHESAILATSGELFGFNSGQFVERTVGLGTELFVSCPFSDSLERMLRGRRCKCSCRLHPVDH